MEVEERYVKFSLRASLFQDRSSPVCVCVILVRGLVIAFRNQAIGDRCLWWEAVCVVSNHHSDLRLLVDGFGEEWHLLQQS